MAIPLRRRVLYTLILSLLLNLVGLSVVVRNGMARRFLVRQDVMVPELIREDWQLKDLERYKLLAQASPAPATILAGDSLIRGGEWDELLGSVRNRGLGGERSDGLLDRLESILDERSEQLVLLYGANDLAQKIPPAQFLRNYRAILERATRRPDPPSILVLGILPINPTIGAGQTADNATICRINRDLATLVGEFPRCRFLDLAPWLADETGNLRPGYTNDGLHLTPRGYAVVAPRVRSELADMKRADTRGDDQVGPRSELTRAATGRRSLAAERAGDWDPPASASEGGAGRGVRRSDESSRRR